MRKQLLKILCMAFLGITGMSYAANAQHWLNSVSGPAAEFQGGYNGNRLAVDSDGNTYTAGTYLGDISSYGVGETGEGGNPSASFTATGSNNKSFIVKTDPDGIVKWTRGMRNSTATTANHVVASTIAVDNVDAGAIYVGGYFAAAINSFQGFSTTPSTVSAPTGEAGFVTKLSKTGDYEWTKAFDGTANQRVTGVATDSEGNLIVVGIYTNTLTITGTTTTITAASGTDAFVAKFAADGTFLFVKSIGGTTGTDTETIWGVAADVDNAIYVSGSTPASALNIGGTALTLGTGTNSYIARLKPDGDVLWAQAILSTQTQTAYTLAVDKESIASRGVYLTGSVSTGGAVNFAGYTITPNNTTTSPFVAKFSAETGGGIWAKIFNTESSAAGYVITVNDNKEVFAGGYAKTSIDFDGNIVPTVNSSGAGEDGFIVKLDSDDEGKVLDYKMIAASSGTDRVLGLVATNSAVYVNGIAGAGTSTPVFTENFVGTGFDFQGRGGSWDVYIMKWGSTTLPVSLTEFKGSKTSLGNLLSWETLSETNNEYFEVERSADAINFSLIKRLTGSGTSTTKINYSYLDTNPLNGINYYRLKQVDINGTFSYSKETVAIDNLLQMDGLKLYPNPGSGIVNVQLPSFSADTEINVYSQTGKLVEFYTNVSGNNQLIDISKQPIGVYYIQVIEKGKSNLIKYLKQ